MNLNVYGYCQRCGRGFSGPEDAADDAKPKKRWYWPFGGSKAA
jgi:hypothetical protein